MSAEDINNLFNLYGKLGRHSKMSRSSCGLGLVISKALCNELGGDILVTSKLGEGSIFTFFVKEERIDDTHSERFVDIEFNNKKKKKLDKDALQIKKKV